MTELKQLAAEVREAERNDVMYEAPHAVETLLTAIDAHDCAQSEAVRELVAALRVAAFLLGEATSVFAAPERAYRLASEANAELRAALAKHGGAR